MKGVNLKYVVHTGTCSSWHDMAWPCFNYFQVLTGVYNESALKESRSMKFPRYNEIFCLLTVARGYIILRT